MPIQNKKTFALIASCAAIFWPGAFIFGFPGVMGPHWQKIFGVGSSAVGQSLFWVLAGTGIFMYPVGRLQEKIGPVRLVAMGAFLCGIATIMVGYARGMTAIYQWAFVTGIASSLIYIPALTVVQRWYPSARGLVTGLVSMVFGLSGAIMSPIFTLLLNGLGYTAMTFITGLLALVMCLAFAGFVRFPSPDGRNVSDTEERSPAQLLNLDVSRSLRTPAFWLLWSTWAMAGASGIAMVTLSAQFGVASGYSIEQAVWVLTAFNLTNGLGRIVSGHFSDRFGRNSTMASTFLCAGIAYLLLPHTSGLTTWAFLAAVVGLAFGTLFAVSAPLASDCFGMKHFGAIFGLVFTGYGFVAGPIGPWLSGLLLDRTQGDFILVFTYLGLLYLVSAITIWFVRPPREGER